MNKILALKPSWLCLIFIAVDTICVGMGMGVPIFCILLGFPVGWLIVKVITARLDSPPQVFRKVLQYALITSAVTLFWMMAIWLPTISILFDPDRDVANFGIPLLLYEPLASFIGWIGLMILVSPVLQLLATTFGAYLALWGWERKRTGAQ